MLPGDAKVNCVVSCPICGDVLFTGSERHLRHQIIYCPECDALDTPHDGMIFNVPIMGE